MTLVDIFSGCGGFSLGAHNAGFTVGAAFDNDAVLTSSYQKNFPRTRMHLKDATKLDGASIQAMTAGHIEGVFGGPPCQGFSDIGRRDAADPRRQLLGHFFRIVAEIQPSFFIMENVRGLAYADARGVLDDALKYVRDRFQIFGPIILDAADFGAATRRRRLFVFGVHKSRGSPLTIEDIEAAMRPASTVRDALADLSDAKFLYEDDEGFDHWQLKKSKRQHKYAERLRSTTNTFTGHQLTIHRPEVVHRFATVPPGDKDPIGRHSRLAWDGQCPTLRAGTGPDRGSFQAVRPLHPDEPRVITVREAARLQGFPDEHRFHPTIWHSFRMIGNSVSPIVAEALFGVFAKKFAHHEAISLAAE